MPCYLVIDGKKREMDEDIFDQMVEALNPETVQQPPMQTSTRWQPDGTNGKKPKDPNIFSKYILSKEIINPFHLSRLRTDNFIQIQLIQTWSNQHLCEKQMPMLKGSSSLPSGNQTWQWEMDHLVRWFSLPETSVQFRDFPASHVWFPEGTSTAHDQAFLAPFASSRHGLLTLRRAEDAGGEGVGGLCVFFKGMG